MTAARIEEIDVDNATLLVSGIDLLDGTPILDIKPYIPNYDAFVDARVPGWVGEEAGEEAGEEEEIEVSVTFEKRALQELRDLSSKSDLFSDSKAMQDTIRDVLLSDPRSRISKKHTEQTYSFTLDNIYVTCNFIQGKQERMARKAWLVTKVVERISPISQEKILDYLREEECGSGITVQKLTRIFYASPKEVADLVDLCVESGFIRMERNKLFLLKN